MRSLSTTTAVLGVVLSLAEAASAAERRHVAPRSPADGNVPPLSGGVLVGDTLYMSGALGRDKDGRVPADPAAEARLVLDAVQATLKDAGMSMDDLVFVQVFCSDVSHYARFNEVYRGYFKKEFPARAFVGSGRLLHDARFEVQGIAVRR